MITKIHDGYVLACDVCDEEEQAGPFDHFEGATEFAKNEGWGIRKNKNGDWENVCPACVSAR